MILRAALIFFSSGNSTLAATDLSEMTPLFYQLGYEQVALALRELLTMLGHDPDA